MTARLQSPKNAFVQSPKNAFDTEALVPGFAATVTGRQVSLLQSYGTGPQNQISPTPQCVTVVDSTPPVGCDRIFFEFDEAATGLNATQLANATYTGLTSGASITTSPEFWCLNPNAITTRWLTSPQDELTPNNWFAAYVIEVSNSPTIQDVVVYQANYGRYGAGRLFGFQLGEPVNVVL